jgi:hypothetical protein
VPAGAYAVASQTGATALHDGGAAGLQVRARDGSADQVFNLAYTADGWATLEQDGQLVTLGAVAQWSVSLVLAEQAASPSDNQLWRVLSTRDGRYQLRSKGTPGQYVALPEPHQEAGWGPATRLAANTFSRPSNNQLVPIDVADPWDLVGYEDPGEPGDPGGPDEPGAGLPPEGDPTIRPSSWTWIRGVSPYRIEAQYSQIDPGYSQEVYRADDPAGPYTLVATTQTGSLSDLGLQPNTGYWYILRRVKEGVPGALSAPIEARTTDLAPPGWTWFRALGPTTIQGQFSHTEAGTTAEIHRATSPDGPYQLVAAPAAGLYLDTGLEPATSYYYKVGLVHDGYRGPVSAPIAVTTPG